MIQASHRQHLRRDANRAYRQEACPPKARTERQPRWVRPFRRLHKALDRSFRLLDSTWRAIDASVESADARPIQTSRRLHRASFRLLAAQAQFSRATRSLEDVTESARQAPEQAADVPWLLLQATQRLIDVAGELASMSNQLYGLHASVCAGLKSGELVPEPPAHRRPRIIVTPRILFARDFLLHRQKSALDRIASVPVRRRPAARIASTDAPRRISRGRAPPSPSTCLL